MLNICFVIASLPDQHEIVNFSPLIAAESLADAGHSVSILFLHAESNEINAIRKFLSHQGRKAIRLIPLSYRGPSISSLLNGVHSYQILHWLLEHASEFEIVHFPLANGVAYYALLAKHQGWAFQQKTLCVDIHSPTMWRKHMHKLWIDQIDDLAADFLERECIRLADILISRDANLLDWMKKEGWQLPKHPHKLQEMIFVGHANEQLKSHWLKLHEKIRLDNFDLISSQNVQLVEKEESQNGRHPLVSVCITHFNRPHFLAQALESIRLQDYPNFEVILVDDASTLPEAHVYLDGLVEEFESKGWQIIRNDNNIFPGAARNHAARQSRGEYLLFMDDDNYAKPNQISMFVQVAKRIGADILTCAMDVFVDHHAPSKETKIIHRFVPLGAAVTVGLYLNIFGDINALIKRQVYEALNGLTEDRGVGGEDWEFFGRAALKGYRLEAIPRALFWYRDTPRSITKTTHLNDNYLRGIRSYIDAVPPELRLNMMLSQAQQQRLHALMIEHSHLGKLLKRCWQLFSLRARRVIYHPAKSFKKIGKHLLNLLRS